MISPTIGRRLWFWPNAHSSTFACLDIKQPMGAGVIFVTNDRKVNLFVTDHFGGTHFVPDCILLQDDDKKPSPPTAFASWMPYQKAAAEKEFNPDAGKAGASHAPLNK